MPELPEQQAHAAAGPATPADVCLMLRAHAELRCLSREVIPVLRQIETRSGLPEDQLGAALAYLEVTWMQARTHAAKTDAACASLAAAGREGGHGGDRAGREGGHGGDRAGREGGHGGDRAGREGGRGGDHAGREGARGGDHAGREGARGDDHAGGGRHGEHPASDPLSTSALRYRTAVTVLRSAVAGRVAALLDGSAAPAGPSPTLDADTHTPTAAATANGSHDHRGMRALLGETAREG